MNIEFTMKVIFWKESQFIKNKNIQFQNTCFYNFKSNVFMYNI